MDKQSKKVLVITMLISIIAFIGIVISFGFNNTFRLKSDVSSYHNLNNYDHKLKVFNLNAYVNTLPSEIEKYDYLKVAFAIQGLVNREQPILYYIWEGSGFSYAGEPIMDNVWLADLKQSGLLLDGYTIEYINSFYDIIDIANDIGAIDGVVLWDNEVPSTSNVASTIAGVENLVPIRYDVSKQSCYTDLVENRKLLGTVKRDLVKKFRNISYLPDQNLNAMSSGTPSSGSSKNDAYLWAKKYYLDTGKTSKTVMGYTEDAWNTRCTTGACFMDASLPDTLQVNEEREITITVLNNNISSNETWTKSGNYRIAAANNGSNGFKITTAEYGFEQGNNVSQARIYLDSTNPIEAGERFKVKFTIKAPSTAGTYYLNLQVVHDGYGWFSGTIKQAITVSNSSTSANTKKTYYGSVPLSLFHSGLNTSDYLIQNKAFMFELSPNPNKKPIDDKTQPLSTDYNTFNAILGSQRTQNNGEIFNVVGFVPWFAKYSTDADPNAGMTAVQSEWAMIDIVSHYNGIVDADAANPIGITNASVFTHETLKTNFTQSNDKNAIMNDNVIKEVYDPGTQYFVLYMGDYDGGSWTSGVYPSRFLMYGVNEAKYPLAWPLAPDLSSRMPHTFNWLYAHQTSNDYFVFGDNGSGYLNPMKSPDLNKWKTHNIEMKNKFDLDITGFLIAGNSGSLSTSVKNTYTEISPVLVGFQGNSAPTVSTVGTTPFIGALNADTARSNPNVSLGTDIYNQLNSTSNKFVIIRSVQFSRVQAYNAIDEVYAKAAAAGKKVKIVDPYTFAQLYMDHPTIYKGCYTDGTNYQWINGTTIPDGYSYTSKMTTEATCGVPRMKLPKPVMATPVMTYTGNPMTPLVNNFDNTKILLTGTHTATNIGDYTVTYTIIDKANYEWEDGSDTDITLNWSIAKIKLEKPVMMTPEIEYTGNPMTPLVINFDYTKITLTGTHTATNKGDYTVTYSITDKTVYEWEDETNNDITLNWSILKAKLPKPTMSILSYPYTGESITPIVSNYNSDLLSTTGSYSATNIGDYTVTLIINDKTNYEWEDETNNDITLNWSIVKAKLPKPIMEVNSYSYTGEPITPTVLNYNSSVMTSTGSTSATNVDDYTITYSIIDKTNYEWEDGTNIDEILDWRILPFTYIKPTINGESTFEYNGNVQSITIDNGTSDGFTSSGTTSETNAGNYSIVYSLKDKNNTTWSDGTTTDVTLNWSISKAQLIKPTFNGESIFTYDGTQKTVSFNNYNTGTMTRTGNVTRTNAGTYPVTFAIIDSDNYEWTDGTTANVVLNWNINKLQVTKPTISGSTEFTYNGNYQGLEFNNLDNTKVDVTGNNQVNVGSYTTTISLKDSTNYEWTDGTSAAQIHAWSITKANLDAAVTMADYYENATPSTPVVTGNSGSGAVTYTYAVKGQDNYSSNAPTTKGEYTVKAVIAATNNYNGQIVTSNFNVLEAEGEIIVLPEGSIITDVGLYGELIDSYNAEKGTNYNYTHLFTEEELASLKTLVISHDNYHGVEVLDLSNLTYLTGLENLTIDFWQDCEIDSLSLLANTELKKLIIRNVIEADTVDLSKNTKLKNLTVNNSTINILNISKSTLDNINLDKPENIGYLMLDKGKDVSYLLNSSSSQDETIKNNSFGITCDKYNIDIGETTNCMVKGKTNTQMLGLVFKLLKNNNNITISDEQVIIDLDGDLQYQLDGPVPVGDFNIISFKVTGVSGGSTKLYLDDYGQNKPKGYVDNVDNDFIEVEDEISKMIYVNKYAVTNSVGTVLTEGNLQTNYILKIVDNYGIYNSAFNIAVLGDVKADGIIDLRDVAKAYDGLANGNYTGYTNTEKYALDMNCDGRKSVLDIIKIYDAIK